MKIREATDKERAEIFTPGNIVPSYGGYLDRVIEYQPVVEGTWFDWCVTVQGLGEDRIRNHCTSPRIALKPGRNTVTVAGYNVVK